MSRISTAYDALTSKMVSIFPTKKRIPFGKEIDRNDINFLKDSWGLWISGNSIQELEFCKYTVGYGFEAQLSREVIFLEHDYSKIDTQIKGMLEDISTLVKALSNVDQISSESNIEQIIVDDISGIEEAFVENSRFIYSTIRFRIIISETL